MELGICFAASAAEVDLTKLPPPADMKVDFSRDVRPIFEQSCLRCHGPEKPKSNFRLTDRESALKGGDENTDDIVPGDSAHSHLIQYVARLVEDMEMPPDGKGEPLTPEQVGILRAWIDQGAHWSATNTAPLFAFSVTPSFRWIGVSGNKSKFREIEGIREGAGGGIENFSLHEQLAPGEKFSAEGHFLFPDQDFQLRLALTKTDVGFVRGGFEQWRRYYDDSGGVDRAVVPPAFSLNRDLHVDNGRAWIDFGLTIPRFPQIVLGYEYLFRRGDEATLDWGFAGGKNIYPATKSLDEQTHVVKLDVSYDAADWRIEDNARVEFYRQNNRGLEGFVFGSGPAPDTFVHSDDRYHHIQGMNTLSAAKQLRDWWLLSSGYFYSRLEADGSFNQTTTDAAGAPTSGNFWNSRVTLSRESHVFSIASLFTPLDYLSLSLGSQNEWTRENGFGRTSLDSGDPNVPALFSLYSFPVTSDLDEVKAMQSANLRFTKIPFTVIFADARVQEDNIGQVNSGQLLATGGSTTPAPFVRRTEFSNGRFDAKAGFNVSPLRWFELTAQLRHLSSDSDYHHLVDSTVNDYPAFIRGRRIETDQIDTKLALRLTAWLKLTLTYQVVATDYSTRTDPIGSPSILAGNYDAHVYGFNVALTPLRRFYFFGSFTYGNSRTATADHGNPSVVPYKGDVYSALVSGTYRLNDSTDLSVAYSFSSADYGQNNFVDGVPLGLNYSRHGVSAGVTKQFSKRVTASLRYAFFKYSEPSTGRINNYTANGVFATATVKWP